MNRQVEHVASPAGDMLQFFCRLVLDELHVMQTSLNMAFVPIEDFVKVPTDIIQCIGSGYFLFPGLWFPSRKYL